MQNIKIKMQYILDILPGMMYTKTIEEVMR